MEGRREVRRLKTWAIIDAEIEAKRFLLAVNKVRLVFPETMADNKAWYIESSKHTARLKRASMDLTRALAEMRRP